MNTLTATTGSTLVSGPVRRIGVLYIQAPPSPDERGLYNAILNRLFESYGRSEATDGHNRLHRRCTQRRSGGRYGHGQYAATTAIGRSKAGFDPRLNNRLRRWRDMNWRREEGAGRRKRPEPSCIYAVRTRRKMSV